MRRVVRPRSDRGRRHKVRKMRSFQELPEDQKYCPDALRFVLTAARQTHEEPAGANQVAFREFLNRACDLPLIFHPTRTRVSAVITPCGAV